MALYLRGCSGHEHDMSRTRRSSLQVECHAYFMQKPLYEFCKQHGITFTAYGPLGSPERPTVNPNDPVLLQEPKLKEIANNHNKTPAQVSSSARSYLCLRVS